MGADHGDCKVKCRIAQIGAQILLFILLAGMAGSVDFGMLKSSFQKKSKGIIVGCTCQFLVLPFLGFATAKIFDLKDYHGIALITTTAAPGGAYSNWWCSLMNADLALSIAMTTCSTLASCLLMPANLVLYSTLAYANTPSMEWFKLMLSILVALAGIITGTVLSAFLPKKRRVMNIIGNVAGIALIIFGAVFSSRDDPLWDKETKLYIAIAAPCVIGLMISFATSFMIPWLSSPEAVAITVETIYQNSGLALSICLATFGPDERGKAAGVPVLYALTQIVVLPLFLLVSWKMGFTYAPSDTSFLNTITKDWQPSSAGSERVSEDALNFTAGPSSNSEPQNVEECSHSIIGNTY